MCSSYRQSNDRLKMVQRKKAKITPTTNRKVVATCDKPFVPRRRPADVRRGIWVEPRINATRKPIPEWHDGIYVCHTHLLLATQICDDLYKPSASSQQGGKSYTTTYPRQAIHFEKRKATEKSGGYNSPIIYHQRLSNQPRNGEKEDRGWKFVFCRRSAL